MRVLESLVGQPLLTVVVAGAAWPWLSTAIQRGVIGAIGFAIIGALTTGGNGAPAMLPSLAAVLKYRIRLHRIRRRWTHAVGVNASIAKTLTASDVAGTPTRTPGVKQVPKLVRWSWRYRPRRTPFGVVVWANGNNIGAISATFATESEVLRGSIRGCRSATPTPDPDKPHLTRIRFVFDDPFAKTIPYHSLPNATEPRSIPIGFDSDGELVQRYLWLPHLIVGESGAGKSSDFHAVIAGVLRLSIPFRLWMCDLKGGVEFFDYEPTAYRYVRSPYEWTAFLQELCNEMQVKLDAIRGKERECPLGDPDLPFDVVIVDELLSVLNFVDDKDRHSLVEITVDDVKRKVKPSKAFAHLLSQCRAGGIFVLAGCQDGKKETVKDRDMFPAVTCLRVASDEMVTALGFKPKEHPAHEIPSHPKYSGIGFTKTNTGVVKYRGGFLTNKERAEVSSRVLAWSQFYWERDKERAG